jgi:predicted short-subunit dehydrogenase-like oxidoreductase (DUF2520 family)
VRPGWHSDCIIRQVSPPLHWKADCFHGSADDLKADLQKRVKNAVRIEKGDNMKNICLMALVVLVSCTAFAINDDEPAKLDGTELAVSCQESAQGFDAGYCSGVVEGVISTSKNICNHSVITLSEAVTIVDKYLKDNPEKLHQRDAALVRAALSKAYPCTSFK